MGKNKPTQHFPFYSLNARMYSKYRFIWPPGLPLAGTVLRVLQYHSETRCDGSSQEDTADEQLHTLGEITAEFLADICLQIPKVTNTVLTLKRIIRPTEMFSYKLSVVSFCFFAGHCGRFGEERLPHREDVSHRRRQFSARL